VSELPPKFRHIEEPDPERYAQSELPLPVDTEQATASAEVAAAEALPAEGVDLKAGLESHEQRLIHQALDATDQVVSKAARLLQIRRTTLVEKMRKYGIERQ
jgi:sigma-54 specific flagellar transcriptional regulator A